MNSLCTEAEMLFIDHGTISLVVSAKCKSSHTNKAEYLFVDLADASCGFANCGGTNTTVSLNENIIRGGVNFKFGGGWW